MYDWQVNKAFSVPKLIPGQAVRLNEQWSGYRYLQREFGSMFPAYIREVHDDVIVVGKSRFARQCLQPL